MTDRLTFWFGRDAEAVWAEHLTRQQEERDRALIAGDACPVVEVDDE